MKEAASKNLVSIKMKERNIDDIIKKYENEIYD